MLSKEQIEACMAPTEWPTMLRHKEDSSLFVDICRLALLALDGERDRKLGAAVREWCNGFDADAGTHAECMDRIAVTCPGTSDAYFALRMLAAALREEPNQ